jgi:hypothetical protein
MDVPAGVMRHESVSAEPKPGIDWKGLGYMVSIVGVFFLGAVAWPEPEDPDWVLPALVAGMAASILGMAFRYMAHLQQQREIRKAKAEARRS